MHYKCALGCFTGMLLFLFTAVGQAACHYSLDKQATFLTWTGYKTNEKAGVKGSFDDIKFSFNEKASSLQQLFESVRFRVDTAKLNSGDQGRDANLKNMIFNLTSALKEHSLIDEISGQVKSFNPTAQKATAEIQMNGQTVTKDFKVTLAPQKDKSMHLSFVSTIDLSQDFKMSDHVSALAKACQALHKGKTWPDVAIEIKTLVKEHC